MSDSEDQSSKTEDPTERKLEKLREEGNVPSSREVNNFMALIGMLFLVGMVGPWGMGRLRDLLGATLQNVGETRADDPSSVGAALTHITSLGLMVLLPALVVMLAVGLAGGLVQNGLIFSAKSLEPSLEKISPMAGMKRMFSLKSFAELVKAILKFGLIGGAMVLVALRFKEPILLLADAGIPAAITVAWRLMLALIGIAIAVMLLLALLDYLFQRMQYMQQHRMSRQELKDEFRESEGDPHIKQRQRQIRQERARKRMMSAVPKADVVITNPTHYSVALRYKAEEGDAAPRVVAKGVDHVALRIREVARDNNVPLYEDPPLARALYAQAELDQEIPLQLYEVVAKVVAFVMELRRKRAN